MATVEQLRKKFKRKQMELNIDQLELRKAELQEELMILEKNIKAQKEKLKEFEED